MRARRILVLFRVLRHTVYYNTSAVISIKLNLNNDTLTSCSRMYRKLEHGKEQARLAGFTE